MKANLKQVHVLCKRLPLLYASACLSIFLSFFLPWQCCSVLNNTSSLLPALHLSFLPNFPFLAFCPSFSLHFPHSSGPPFLLSCRPFLPFFKSLLAASPPCRQPYAALLMAGCCMVECGLFALPLRFTLLTSVPLHLVWTRLAGWTADTLTAV